MNQKMERGHGYYRKSKAYGLVCGIMLAGMLTITTSVGAEELTNTYVADTSAPVALPAESETVEPITVKVVDEATKTEVARVSKDTVVEWEESKTIDLPSDRPHTETLTVTTPVDPTEEVNIDKTNELNKEAGWSAELKDKEVVYTANKELLDKVNTKAYTNITGQETFETKAIETDRVRKETETYEVDVTKTREVTEEVPVTKTREVTEEVPVTKTRLVDKTVTETTMDYTTSPLNIGYILDTSNSRKEIVASATSTLNKFLGTLDKSKIEVYAEDYAYDYVSAGTGLSSGWSFAGNTVKVEGGSSTLKIIYDKTGTSLSRAKKITEALKQANGSADTVIVIESDFDDFGGFSSGATTSFFKDAKNLEDLPEGVKLLLIEDAESNGTKDEATTNLEEIVSGRVWRVSTKNADGSIFDRNEILNTFMKTIAKETTVSKVVQVEEEYTEMETRTRTEEYTEMETRTRTEEYVEKETRTREVDVPYKVLEPIVISVENGDGAKITSVTVEEVGKAPQSLELVDGKATFTPTVVGTVKVTYTYEHDGVETTSVKIVATSKNTVTGETLTENESTKALPTNGKYESVSIKLPVTVSKLTAYDTKYERAYAVKVNEGLDNAYTLDIKGGQLLTEKAPAKVVNPVKVEKSPTKPEEKPQTITPVAVSTKVLPKTGTATSFLSLVGAVMLPLLALGTKKKEENN
ncbi:putative cross-wall-targeting lipoprotein signal domain-containing proteiin [Streptococcus ovuberis]|uniref:LPXTG cell wall anchor domain-containing protein n=1 Tax=Streptococcus ovuberis TaxID=1936207 RepID=A0A7X6MZZ8_9STRE|nr:putative cross-wall-targeting lipoprotein signal domain-containing proteiin [Streptococcus ovuberis]NKZ19702.1 LPXTG cell wall anchor domain-containing protein [Streptococcus ovuberis]